MRYASFASTFEIWAIHQIYIRRHSKEPRPVGGVLYLQFISKIYTNGLFFVKKKIRMGKNINDV